MQNQAWGKDRRRLVFWSSLLFATLYFLFSAASVQAATLSLVTSDRDVEVGDTFEVSVLLSTGGEEVNAVEIDLEFPADKLQVVSPNTGRSIIEIWAGQPKFNNRTGSIEMRGGIPNGISIENGLITTVQFRVRASGSVSIQFTPQSKVLANDGLGTDLLVHTPGLVLSAKLPKPEGPAVSSLTHTDQGRWYPNPNVTLEWLADDGIEGYSYILNDEAIFEPDTISEGLATDVAYDGLTSGIRYFHIRSMRAGEWGGTTHFQVNIDNAPPAEFPIEVIPSARTSSRQPVLKFFTTDAQSGVDHFEIKLVMLSPSADGKPLDGELFTEAQSPYVSYPLELGNYDVIVRAYDKARNYREAKERITITSPVFSIVQDNGFRLTETFTLTWLWIWTFALIILSFFVFASWRLKHWPRKLGMHHREGQVPESVSKQLSELRAYQKRYGKIAVMVLFALSVAFGGSSARAAFVPTKPSSVLTPPTVTTISNDITSADTFYVGGETAVPETTVVVYWSNLTTGETLSAMTSSTENGEWFYHHQTNLRVGNYVLWTQTRVGETVSPPSAQFTMVVRPDSLKLGPARVSYEFAYLAIIIVLVAVLLTMGLLIVRKWHVIKKRHRQFMEELRASEESIRRGFAVLRRDLEVEFAAIKSTRAKRALSREEQARERQIAADIEAIQNKIGKEIWELERLENSE